jgi:hypothetical protein
MYELLTDKVAYIGAVFDKLVNGKLVEHVR